MMKSKLILYSFFSLLFVTVCCAGWAKLKFSSEYAQTAAPASPIPFQSNLRQNSVDSDISPPYKIIWETGVKSMVPDQPLAFDQYLVYTLKNGNIGFLDTRTGKVMAENRIAPAFEHAPVIDKYTVFYAANLGKETLVSFNLLELRKNWSVNLPHIYTTPLMWKNYIYVGSKDGSFFAVDKMSGETRWEYRANASLFGTPAEQNGKIFFCDVKGSVYCIDGLTGELQWRTELLPNIYGGPALSNQQVFIGNTAGILYALEATSGKILWETATGGSIYSNIALKENMLYVGNNSNKMLAINARDGQILWEFQTKGIINSAPLVGKNFLYFGAWDKNVYILSRYSGELIQKIEFKRPVKSSPLLYENKLFLHVANDRFYGIGTFDSPSGGVKR